MNQNLTIAVFNQKQKAVLSPVVMVTSNGKGSIFPLSLVNKLERGGWILLKEVLHQKLGLFLAEDTRLARKDQFNSGIEIFCQCGCIAAAGGIGDASGMLPLFCPRVDR